MLTNFRVGDRVEDKETHKRGRVTFVYSELELKGESPPYQSSSPSVATQLKPDLLPVLADRGAISFRNVGTKSTPHPAEIVPKRDAHHILTPGYVKIILWLEYSL
jgi:hypothetical protein